MSTKHFLASIVRDASSAAGIGDRRRRSRRRAGRSWSIFGLWLAGFACTPAYAQDECETARSFEATGQLDAALEQYRQLFDDPQPPECASAGAARVQAAMAADALAKLLELARFVDLDATVQALESTIETRSPSSQQLREFREELQTLTLARGEELLSAGDRETAAERFKRVIELDPASKAAKRAKGHLLEIELAAVRGLVATGQYQQARERLKSNPALISTDGIDDAEVGVPSDLEFLDNEFAVAAREIGRFWIEWRPWILAVVLAAAVLAVVRWLARRWRRPLLEIEEFDNSGLDTEVGTGFAAMVRSRLSRLSHSAQSQDRIQLITAPIEPVDIPADVQSSVPSRFAWVGILPWVWSKLFPRDTFRLSGYLHPPGRRGPGVTFQLSREKGVEAADTLWQHDFLGGQPVDTKEEIASFYRLADYGSVWLAFHLRGRKFSYLGTDKWYALALSRAAYHQLEIDKQFEAAKALYLEALKADPRFPSAKLNLALLTGKSDKKFAIDLLGEVKDTLTERDARADDPSIYAAYYSRANWLYELSVDADRHGSAERDDSRAGRLLAEAEQEIRELQDLVTEMMDGDRTKLHGAMPTVGSDRERLKEYLERVEQFARLLLAGLVAAQGRTAEAIRLIARNEETIGSDPSNGANGQTELPEPPPLELDMTLASGVQFNLACACSLIASSLPTDVRGPWLAKALKHLRRALLLGETADDVDGDPSLAALCSDPALGSEYRALISEFSAPEPPSAPPPELALAESILIGDTFASALADEDIDSPGELIQRSRTAPERAALAAKLQVDAGVFDQWVRFAELMRLTGLAIGEANLIYLAGARSVTELAVADPARLYAAAAAMAEAHGVAVAPKERYALWVREAAGLPELVV